MRELKLYLQYLNGITQVVKEIKEVVHKGENYLMDKGSYKDFEGSEFVHGARKEDVEGMSLTDLLNRKPTDEEYEEILSLLTTLAKRTYADFKFLIAKSSDETKEPHFLQIVSHYEEAPALHKKIFRKAIEYGIDMRKLQEKFAEKVANGKVIDLGPDVVVITNDNTTTLPTGVSPINSGLEGGEIAFIISFLTRANYGEWHKNTFPEKGEGAG